MAVGAMCLTFFDNLGDFNMGENPYGNLRPSELIALYDEVTKNATDSDDREKLRLLHQAYVALMGEDMPSGPPLFAEECSGEWLVVTFAPGFDFLAGYDTRDEAFMAARKLTGLSNPDGTAISADDVAAPEFGALQDYVAVIKAELLILR
jgi:hypothetical protein